MGVQVGVHDLSGGQRNPAATTEGVGASQGANPQPAYINLQDPTAAGVPAFSPHDLRHRRISLLHLGGVPWARIGEHVGQRNLAVTASTYTHVLTDEAEVDYATLNRCR